jgi:pimeloyl-ACP methyl ester carboxylesterase
VTRTETIDTPILNFSKDWGLGAPINTPVDRFSARFSTMRWLAAGLYKIQTQADDGVKVTIGGQQVIDRWSENGNFQNTGFFRSSGADVPIVVEYYENEGAASLSFNISPVDKFQDPRNSMTNWDATVFTWDESKGTRPSVDFFNGDFNNPNVIGITDLGSNIRPDGKPGFLADWRSGALKGDGARLPNDYFAVRAYTTAQFDGGEYVFRAKADDGFQLFAKNKATGQWFYITPQASWEASSTIYKEYTYILPKGSYDLHYHFYEKTGNASFDLNWEKIGIDTVGNTLAAAKEIILGQSTQSIQEFLYERDTDDIYKFIVPTATSASNDGASHASMNFRINLAADFPGLELSIIEDKDKNYIVNEQNEVYQATNFGKTQQSIGRLLTEGTYYIRVHRTSGSSTYNLSLDPVILSGTASNQASVSGSTTGQVELWKHSIVDGSRISAGDEIKSNIETVIIIHGWNDNDINDRARRLFTSFNGKNIQVLAVNWEVLANEKNNKDESYLNNSNFPKRPNNTSQWIMSVSKVVAELVEKLKINNEKITLIGHSLGAYVASETANFLAMKGLQPQNLVLLDPAFPAGQYDLDGNRNGNQTSGSFDRTTQDGKGRIQGLGEYKGMPL